MTISHCAVIYLARKVDGLRYLPRFLFSLQRYPAGREYDLIIILKGYDEREVPACLEGFRAQGLGTVHVMTFDDDHFATEAFFAASERFTYSALLFFVSSARILAPDWGRIIFDTLADNNVRLVGGSSGFEPLNESTPFPNPSIRTTGFAIRRNDWLALERGDLSKRYGGNLFEAGPRSMTKQILQQGGTVLLVGRDGRRFPEETWRDSRTFRLSSQENLLFADSRTEQFDLSLPRKRQHMAELNWGKGVAVMTVPRTLIYLRRLQTTMMQFWWRLIGSFLISR